MKQNTPLRLLAIAAATALVFTACGGDDDNAPSGGRHPGGSGAGVPYGGTPNPGGNPWWYTPTPTPTDTSTTDTPTPPTPPTNTNTDTGSSDTDTGTTDTSTTDTSTTDTSTSSITAERMRFYHHPDGAVDIELFDASDNLVTDSGQATVTVTGGAIGGGDITITGGKGSFNVTQALGDVSTFTLTAGVKSFKGVLDPGSYTRTTPEHREYFVFGCNVHSPVHGDFKAELSPILPLGASLRLGTTYTYKYTPKYLDSNGQPLTEGVSRDVILRLYAGSATINNSTTLAADTTVQTFMENGAGTEDTFTPAATGSFTLGMHDLDCAEATFNATGVRNWPRDDYKIKYTVIP